MSDFHDNYPHYEVMSNHGEEEGKKIPSHLMERVLDNACHNHF